MPQVSVTNTTSPTEPKPNLYILPFTHEIVEKILAKKKARTFRYGLKFDYLKVGDQIQIQDSDTQKIICAAQITDKISTTFKGLPLESILQTYKNKEEQRKKYCEYYAYIGREIQNDDPFLILELQVAGQY